MARLTLTNDRAMHLSVLETDKRAGFTDYDTAEIGGVFLAVHRKKRHPIENFVKMPNGDLVATAGTFIYKGMLGAKALERLYQDFDGDIEGLRKAAMGDYLVAVKKGRDVVLFQDKYEGLLVYYHHDGKNWIVGNSLSAVAEAVCRKDKGLTVNELALVEMAFLDAALGRDTVFKNIYRVRAMQRVSVDTAAASMEFTSLPYERQITDAADLTLDKMAAKHANLLRTRLRTLADVFGDSISILATGGMDNRLLLAGFLSCGVKPTLVHCSGVTPPGDLAVVRMHAAKFGLKMREVEWPPYFDAPPARYDDLFRKNGFFAAIGQSRDFFDGFESGAITETKLLLMGFWGELVRTIGSLDHSRYWQERFAKKHISIDEFTDYHLSGYNTHTRPAVRVPYDVLYQYLRNKLDEGVASYGVQKQNGLFRNDSFQVLFESWLTSTEPTWGNVANQFTGCVSVFNTYDLHELGFEVPFAWRKHNHFALKVMEQLWPPVLDVPFFSHTRHIVLNRKALKLQEPWASRLVHGTIHRLEKLPGGRGLHQALRPLHLGSWLERLQKPLRYKQGEKPTDLTGYDPQIGDKELEVFKSLVAAEQQEQGLKLVDPNAYTGALFRLARYWRYLYCIRKVREAAAAG